MSDDEDTTSVVEFKKPTNNGRQDGETKRERLSKRDRAPAPKASDVQTFNGRYGGLKDGNWGFTMGQHLACKIVARERAGYAVIIEGGRPGFLKTPDALKVGKKITAEFICVMDNRALMAALPESLQSGGIKSFGMVEDTLHGAEVVQLFGKKDDPV